MQRATATNDGLMGCCTEELSISLRESPCRLHPKLPSLNNRNRDSTEEELPKHKAVVAGGSLFHFSLDQPSRLCLLAAVMADRISSTVPATSAAAAAPPQHGVTVERLYNRFFGAGACEPAKDGGVEGSGGSAAAEDDGGEISFPGLVPLPSIGGGGTS
jgi:hypothetical protein